MKFVYITNTTQPVIFSLFLIG